MMLKFKDRVRGYAELHSYVAALLANRILKSRIKEVAEGMKKGRVKNEDKEWKIHYMGYDEALSDILKELGI